MTTSPDTDQAAQIRGPLLSRRLHARSTAAMLDNPGCVRRAVLDGAAVDTARLAEVVGEPVAFGQSPFAIGQGNRFEARVKADGYTELVRVLSEVGVTLPPRLRAESMGDIRDSVVIHHAPLMVVGFVVGLLFAVSVRLQYRIGRRGYQLLLYLALFDFVGEFVAQGTLAIEIVVSIVVAAIVLLTLFLKRKTLLQVR